MKKTLYFLILFSIFTLNTQAFSVDVNKIKIGARSEGLVENLNKSYKIDVESFAREEVNVSIDNDELVKNLTKIALVKDTKEKKKKIITEYQYFSNDNGGETIASSIFIDAYLDRLEELDIEASYIREIRNVSFNENDLLSFVYLNNAKVNGNIEDVILIYWLKEDNNEYRLFYPLVTVGKDMDAYFDKVNKGEESGEIISGAYKSISLMGEVHEINNDELRNVYQNNIKSVVQITGMSNNGANMYGSGFYLRDGVIVTTWSKFLKFLTDSNYIYVNDESGKTYQVLGVIAAEINYDVVVLKISESVGTGVSFGDSSLLKTDDTLFMINSKNNNGFSISYGNFISESNGKMKNMLLLNDSDVGSALFNKDGKVVGIATGDKINSDLSYANSTNYLGRLQTILNSQSYQKIAYTKLETFKQSYYTNIDTEKTYNYVNSKVLEKFKKIGNLESNITLDLVKASYVDKILSLRYRFDTNNMIDTLFLTASYTEQLVLDGYKLTYEDDYKRIYQNNKYKIIIKSNLHYLIILIMEN